MMEPCESSFWIQKNSTDGWYKRIMFICCYTLLCSRHSLTPSNWYCIVCQQCETDFIRPTLHSKTWMGHLEGALNCWTNKLALSSVFALRITIWTSNFLLYYYVLNMAFTLKWEYFVLAFRTLDKQSCFIMLLWFFFKCYIHRSRITFWPHV